MEEFTVLTIVFISIVWLVVKVIRTTGNGTSCNHCGYFEQCEKRGQKT